MTKLNQIIAVEKGAKTNAAAALTEAYHMSQRAQAFSGISRTYRPKDDEGDQLPPESTRVLTTVYQLIDEMRKPLARLIDVVVTKDATNTIAKADVKADGHVVLDEMPVTTLLFIEKQLTDLHALVVRLPLLDASEKWDWDSAVGAHASAPVSTHRTKKIKRSQVLYEATDRHPAQVQTYDEDETVGYWKTIKFSGALSAQQRSEMLERINKLRDAVKVAREEANSVETVHRHGYGDVILDYVFGAAGRTQ